MQHSATGKNRETDNIEINETFKHAISLMNNTNQNLFITGKAGTGKSTLLDYFYKNSSKRTILLAPTGVAALNIKGQTIHSFFNFYIDVTTASIKERKTRPKDPKIYKKIQSIIIDEISMVRADLLDCIHEFLKIYGPLPTEPFGGIQMIFVGDLYQLPPVATKADKEIFHTIYSTPYFFSAHIINSIDLKIIELEHVYRQKDPHFIELLNRIRNNSAEPNDITYLNSRHTTQQNHKNQDFYINLTTTNKKAEEINNTHLDSLPGEIHTSIAQIEGKITKEYYPTSTELQFKVGSQIMLLNNDQKKRWVNGSIGIIKEIITPPYEEDHIKIYLHETNKTISVYPFAWEVHKFTLENNKIVSQPIGTFTQYPFRLAWAITIHKSQGKTFNNVIIDIDRGTFTPGQLYVALSRCTSFQGIRLKTPIKPHNIYTDTRIFKFLTHSQYKESHKNLPINDKINLITQAINNKKQLKMTYLKANNTKSYHTVIPLTIGTEIYNNKQFPGLKAFCTIKNKEHMFHAGRILKLAIVTHEPSKCD